MFTLLASAFIIMCINSAGAYYFLAVVIFCIVGALVGIGGLVWDWLLASTT